MNGSGSILEALLLATMSSCSCLIFNGLFFECLNFDLNTLYKSRKGGIAEQCTDNKSGRKCLKDTFSLVTVPQQGTASCMTDDTASYSPTTQIDNVILILTVLWLSHSHTIGVHKDFNHQTILSWGTVYGTE